MGLLLFADDDECRLATLRSVARFFAENGHRTEVFDDGRRVHHRIRDEAPDVVVSALMLAGRDGFELARDLRQLYPDRGAGVILTVGLAAEVGAWLRLPPEMLSLVDSVVIRPSSGHPGPNWFHEQLVVSVGLLLVRRGIAPVGTGV